MSSPMHFLSWTFSRRQVLGDHRGRAGLNPFLLIKTRRSASAIVVRAAMETNAHLGDKGASEAFKAGAEDNAGSTAAKEEETR